VTGAGRSEVCDHHRRCANISYLKILWDVGSDGDQEYENDIQHHPHIYASTENIPRPIATPQTIWQVPHWGTLYYDDGRAQAEEQSEEIAWIDTPLESTLREKNIAEGYATNQFATKEQQAGEIEKVEAARVEKGMQNQNYTRAPICSHRGWWPQVSDRYRCAYRVYGYARGRFQCPHCKLIACKKCMKKLKAGVTP